MYFFKCTGKCVLANNIGHKVGEDPQVRCECLPAFTGSQCETGLGCLDFCKNGGNCTIGGK